MDATDAKIKVSPVAGRIGAIIEGVQLSGALAPEIIAGIRAALLQYKVVFFRDQHTVGDAEMEGSAETMGDPIPFPNLADPQGSRYLLKLDEGLG